MSAEIQRRGGIKLVADNDQDYLFKKMKVLIAAGGTGGHIYPGIAVAKEIIRRDAESEVLFVGTARGL